MVERELRERVAGADEEDSLSGIWIAPAIRQDWGIARRPGRHELNLYWKEPSRLHEHWIVRSGARIDESFAQMDRLFRAWAPTEAHKRVRGQAFAWWSNYDSSGEKIIQVPYLLRAVSGEDVDAAMEALRTLSVHLFHQGTVAGGVSLIFPVLAELVNRELTLLRGSVHALMSLVKLPHVAKILPGFIPPALDLESDEQVSYCFPRWGVLPNEVASRQTLVAGRRRVECSSQRVALDHQLPFSDRLDVGRQNDLQVDGEFVEVETSGANERVKSTVIRVGDMVIQSGELALGGRNRRGRRVGRWEGAWPDGSRRFEAEYVEGKRQGVVRTFAPEGTTLTECSYRNNQRAGRWRQWFPSGALVVEGQFTGNRPSGAWKGYYPEGAPRFEGRFREGLRCGTWRYWDSSGSLIERFHDFD